MRGGFSRTLPALLLFGAASAAAQDAPPERRPPEGTWIINLPSADVPAPGNLTLLFSHRFSEDVADSDFDSLFSFDSPASIGIGLGYVPVRNLQLWLQRSSYLTVYEASARYRAAAVGPLVVSLRAGADWRTEQGANFDLQPDYSRNGVFAQAILAFSPGDRIRITAVPTWVSETSGQPLTQPRGRYRNLFNVPLALSLALTRSVNLQAEVVGRPSRGDSTGVGWIAAVEKTVLRHRFAFTVGNLRPTTADQYVAPNFAGFSPHDYYFGFNLVRQWKLR